MSSGGDDDDDESVGSQIRQMRARIRERYGDAARATLPADVKLVEEGALWWLMVDRGALTSWDGWFFVDGAWRPLTGIDAFRQCVADNMPDVKQWHPLVRAYTKLSIGAEALLTRADVDDLADPRWHLFPKDVKAWEPPRFDGRVLAFFVLDRGAVERVVVDGETFAVDVVRVE